MKELYLHIEKMCSLIRHQITTANIRILFVSIFQEISLQMSISIIQETSFQIMVISKHWKYGPIIDPMSKMFMIFTKISRGADTKYEIFSYSI